MRSRTPLPSQEELRNLFNYDDGFLFRKIPAQNNRRKAGDIAGTMNANGCYYVKIKKATYLGHRLIWKWHHGTEPANVIHINGDKLDNAISNLSGED